MFFFKRIKQLEEQVAELYALLVNKQTLKEPNVAETPTEPKPRRKNRARKLNGKEKNSAK
jgi:hypothetical protein